MRNTLKTVIVLLFLIGVTISGIAQTKPLASPEERADIQTTIMTRVLTLAEDQIQPVEDINLRYSRKAEEILNKDSSRREKFKAIWQLIEEKGAELKNVLTEAQYTIYREKKAALQQRIRERRKS